MNTSSERTLGGLIRCLRIRNGWTLREMAAKVGIPFSTLSKVEHDRLTLTYEKLRQLSFRLGMTMAEFVSQAETAAPRPGSAMVIARRSFAANGNSVQVLTPSCDYEYLCADLRHKMMDPIIARIRARDIAEFSEPLRHAGEEFIFVLEGTIEVHSQFYTPMTLTMGHWIYLDGTMRHAYLAKNCDSALVLTVRCGSPMVNRG